MRALRKAPFILLFIIPLFLFSCAHVNKRIDQNIKSEPYQIGNNPQDESASERKASHTVDEDIEGIIKQAEKLYTAGVENYAKGKLPEAKQSFDTAVEIFLTCGYNLYDFPELEEAYNAMVERISEFESNSLGASVSSDAFDTPVDTLGEMQAAISPEEALKEREIVGMGIESLGLGNMIELNNDVLSFLNYYSRTINDKFQMGIRRSGAYTDMMKQIFREEGIPENLVYVAHVESSFKPFAYSRAKAKGIWQFIASTGRKYGLRIDWWIDERSDPEKAARAAAAYLKDLYAMFGDWNLALAAYNAGEGKIQRALNKTGCSDFWCIAKTRYIRRETKNYIPAIHAAILIANEPQKYGFAENYDEPLQYDKVVVDSPTDLRVIAKCSETTAEEIKKLNPALYRIQTPPGYPEFAVSIPAGKKEIFESNFARVPREDRILYVRHLVRRGETLSTIARKYGTSVSAIQRANNMGRRTLIREKSYLIIPGSSSYSAELSGSFSAQSYDGENYQAGEKVIYKVRRGDSLFSIARKFGTDVDSIAAWNDISKSKTIYPGEKLAVYARTRARSRASSEKYAADDSGRKLVYTVRKGDTLYKIANQHNTTIDKLCFWNQISKHTTIYPGNKMTIYLD